MGLKALIWDVDGTLVDSEEIHRAAFNHTFTERKLDWHWDRSLYAHLLRVTGGRERLRYYMDIMDCAPTGPEDLDKFILSLHIQKTAIYNHLLRVGPVRLRPGVKRILRQARDQGVLLAIATTTSRRNVETLLARTLYREGITWEIVVSGEDVKRKKPFPEVYLKVLGQLGLEPGQCVALEDSQNGVESASAAGIATIVTKNCYTRDDDFSKAGIVLSHFGDKNHAVEILAGSFPFEGEVQLDDIVDWLESWRR